MKVEIITIGDEILIGQITDTNSAWMAQELTKNGFSIYQITSVSDNTEHIQSTLDEALKNVDIVLITGGLGPTKDDITKQALSSYFQTQLVFNQEAYDHIEKKILSSSNYRMNELNSSQAYVPENAVVIMNEAGTAPITWFEQDGKIIVSMPGVPAEMKWAMKNEIMPRLQKKISFSSNLIYKHFLVYGYPESELALKLADWEDALPPYMKLAYLPSLGIMKLRLGAENEETSVQQQIEQESEKLHAILGNAILADEDIALEALIGRILKEKDLTISTAESCTGGNIARMITSVPGSSAYFKGSVVAYENEIKEKLLEVSDYDISQYGVVSLPVVEQMAKGVLELMETDIAVATSGIAGPGGGSDEKPVGTVCIAVATKDGIKSRQFLFGKIREKNIVRSSIAALVMVYEAIS